MLDGEMHGRQSIPKALYDERYRGAYMADDGFGAWVSAISDAARLPTRWHSCPASPGPSWTSVAVQAAGRRCWRCGIPPRASAASTHLGRGDRQGADPDPRSIASTPSTAAAPGYRTTRSTSCSRTTSWSMSVASNSPLPRSRGRLVEAVTPASSFHAATPVRFRSA